MKVIFYFLDQLFYFGKVEFKAISVKGTHTISKKIEVRPGTRSDNPKKLFCL